jgi:hypothetical protein
MIVFAIVVFSVLSFSGAQAQALPADLARAAHEYDEAQIKGDRPALERLVAPDYVLVNSRGLVSGRRELIDGYTTPGNSIEPFEIRDPVERVWENGAVLGGLVTLRGMSEGRPFEATLRFADVWAKRNGVWQVVFTEVTVAAPEDRANTAH